MHQLGMIIWVSICIGFASVRASSLPDVLGGCHVESRARGSCWYGRWDECVKNADCQRGQQCCQVGCNRKCIVVRRRISRNLVRNGVCPRPPGRNTFCKHRRGYNCFRDSECSPGQKCCTDICGRICKNVS